MNKRAMHSGCSPQSAPTLTACVMRLGNEKTLTALATRRPDHSGHLMTCSDSGGRVLQRRWCSLTGNLFFYSDKKGDKEPIGCVVLSSGYRIELCDGPLTFAIAFPGRTYVFAAESPAELDLWVRLLSRAQYDSLKFTADELAHRLSDLRPGATPPVRPARHSLPDRCMFSRRPFHEVHKYLGRHWTGAEDTLPLQDHSRQSTHTLFRPESRHASACPP